MKNTKKIVPSNASIQKETYNQLLKESRQYLSPISNYASMIVHSSFVDLVSDVISKYIFRANSVLFASVCVFIVILITTVLKVIYGYKFSGAELYIGFICGWLIGYCYDVYELLINKIRKSIEP